MNKIEWACKSGCANSLDWIALHHWSRQFEYPWVIRNADLKPNQITLDAAGGDAPMQLIAAKKTGVLFNIDSDQEGLDRGKKNWHQPNVIYLQGDLKKLEDVVGLGFFFDRVLCVSVLEHDPDHMDLIRELVRVTKPGGRLLLTFDVASYSRWNHSIDMERAKMIADYFRMQLPPEPADIMSITLPEIERAANDPHSVDLKVLCLAWDKPSGSMI